MKGWRNPGVLAALLFVLAVINVAIAGRIRLEREGEVLLLELAPVDPRSLMQGDYMALAFTLEQEVRTQANARHADGYLVVRRDPRQVARFVRLQAAPLPCAADELALRYRVRNGRPRIVTNAWFFPEGQAERYAPARYGEFRVGQDGEALLVALRDQELRPL